MKNREKRRKSGYTQENKGVVVFGVYPCLPAGIKHGIFSGGKKQHKDRNMRLSAVQ